MITNNHDCLTCFLGKTVFVFSHFFEDLQRSFKSIRTITEVRNRNAEDANLHYLCNFV